ncbi:MAG: hypothetical protein JNM62_10095 [Flavobacteriales bacterium]|nr:hypothetical protein [Flavobacteriales bacterium]
MDHYTAFEISDMREWLYRYMVSSEQEQRQMKRNKNFSWSNKASGFVEALPVSGSNHLNANSARSEDRFYQMQLMAINQQYLTDYQFKDIVSDRFSDNMLSAYKACLEVCKQQQIGVSYLTGGDMAGIFFIQVQYDSKPAGGSVTLKGPALYTGMIPVGTNLFVDGLVLADGRGFSQYFKRVDSRVPASLVINVREQMSVPALQIPGVPVVDRNATPIGSIVSSVLPYNEFMAANGFESMTAAMDLSVIPWVPCDGRAVGSSMYGKYSGGNVPDLRGQFLRGINDYGVPSPSLAPLSDNRKNPEGQSAGQFQDDGVGNHTHGYLTNNTPGTSVGLACAPNNASSVFSTQGNSGATGDTRPRNVTVYFYIRIN